MLRYVVRRTLFAVPVLLGVSIVVFGVMAAIPGDPALAILGAYATPENLAALRADLGLDEPIVARYFIWLDGLLQGDLGRSFALDRPVLDEVMDRMGPTLLLAGSALILCAALGLFAGVVAAVRQNEWPDRLATIFVLIGVSTPSFWLGLLLVLLFSVELRWLPVSGMVEAYGGGGALDVLRHLILPATTLALVAAGVVARMTRAGMLETLRQDYVRTARAKGLSERTVIWRHAFKNALVGVVPILGLQAGFVLAGAVYVETVFQWPGVGRMLVNAIRTRDVLLAQGGVLIIASAYVFVNLAADVVQTALDPRIST